ncbi:10656_t:CDS:2, partial [Scutellospora calospora]
LEDIDRIEYLLSVLTNGLLIRVRAAIYLSLDELWEVPTDIALVVTFLDPRFKHFNWATSVEQNRVQNLVKTLYDELKINLAIPDDNEENLSAKVGLLCKFWSKFFYVIPDPAILHLIINQIIGQLCAVISFTITLRFNNLIPYFLLACRTFIVQQ